VAEREATLKKIGDTWIPLALWALVAAAPARAADVKFTAEADRTELGMDESVSLKLNAEYEGDVSFSEPTIQAPDFEVVNQYSGSFTRSTYTNGRFEVRYSQSITKVLRPLKTGALRISQIQIKADNQVYHAPDVVVQVSPAGAGSPPPRGYGGGGNGLRGSLKPASGRPVMIRAEVDRQKAYKGEQIVVSYYVLRRAQLNNLNVDKFPELKGFLREELEMPYLQGRLEWKKEILDGVAYYKALLIRYAAYPLQEGKLRVDPLSTKCTYFAQPGGGLSDEEDPFMQFFRQLTPRVVSEKSDGLDIEVLPLPEDGKPPTFTGGVGDFGIVAAVDKVEARANEPVTLTVKVEGRGNVAAIGSPKAKWPDNVELYDSKGQAKPSKAGVGTKIFEFLLIPRAPGKVTLPSLDFSFFDPVRKAYVTKSTEPITLTVTEAAPGSAPAAGNPATAVAPANPAAPRAEAAAPKEDLAYWLPPETGAGKITVKGHPLWRWLYWLCAAGFVAFVGVVLRDILRKGRARAVRDPRQGSRAEAKSWQALRARADSAAQGAAWNEVTALYESLAGAVFDALDRVHAVGARSYSRADLKIMLVDDRGVPEALWRRLEQVLEFAENVRYASSAGAVAESSARQQATQWVGQAQEAAAELEIAAKTRP
jgi:hypothetical protein